MSQTTTVPDSAPVSQDEAWGYVCGRIAVLETQLLPRGFFEGMLKSKSVADARSTLAKTTYRAVFTADEQVRGFSDVLDVWADSVVNDLLAVSPPHMIISFFEALRRYPVFRGLFIKAAGRSASPSDLEATFEAIATNPFERSVLEGHCAMLRAKDSPQTADTVARSLFLDSAILTLRLAIAESASEEKVRGLLRDIAVLQCWTAVLRSRWNGTSSDVIRRWFIIPDLYADMVKNVASLADTNPVGGISGFVSERVLRSLRETGNEQIRRNVDAAAGEAVRDQALELRSTVYGPERVLAFLVAYAVEQENLRLALTSTVHGVEPRIVMERLRREYA